VSGLDALYRRAGVVISPLRVGSGLKVKLVEALGWGKAIVATSVTAQGVGSLVKEAIVFADEAEDFADEVVDLMANQPRRKRYADAALQVAKVHFGREACYGEILSFIRERASPERRDRIASAALWPAAVPASALTANPTSSISS
jgi:succinoglycan biosynthesis protein ExoO